MSKHGNAPVIGSVDDEEQVRRLLARIREAS
jgi:hypothetical protein